MNKDSIAPVVEVIGVWEHNQGAMLMLEAIKQQLSSSIPGARIAVPASMSRSVREEYKLLGVLEGNSKRMKLLRLLPSFLLRTQKLIKPDGVDVLLDASGFGYGDYWGISKLRNRLTRRLASWKSPGCVAILLPQALGPFEDPGMCAEFSEALSFIDLAFARDGQSYLYAERCVPDGYELGRAPDFTNLLKPELASEMNKWRGYSFIIPNEKMIAKADEHETTRYLNFLQICAQKISASGRSVAILVHEGEQDLGLAQVIQTKMAVPVPIVVPRSALETKALISTADLIISSRFHGLVSALSSGVPALACGWSHKYEALMSDYQVAQYCIRLDDSEATLRLIDQFLGDARKETFREDIKRAAAEQRMLSTNMWRQCVSMIRAKAI